MSNSDIYYAMPWDSVGTMDERQSATRPNIQTLRARAEDVHSGNVGNELASVAFSSGRQTDDSMRQISWDKFGTVAAKNWGILANLGKEPTSDKPLIHIAFVIYKYLVISDR